MSVNNEADLRNEHETVATDNGQEETPIYQKPILRKYDQIEQVKPYGPSELEAG
jgi:hypothetical protein